MSKKIELNEFDIVDYLNPDYVSICANSNRELDERLEEMLLSGVVLRGYMYLEINGKYYQDIYLANRGKNE